MVVELLPWWGSNLGGGACCRVGRWRCCAESLLVLVPCFGVVLLGWCCFSLLGGCSRVVVLLLPCAGVSVVAFFGGVLFEGGL